MAQAWHTSLKQTAASHLNVLAKAGAITHITGVSSRGLSTAASSSGFPFLHLSKQAAPSILAPPHSAANGAVASGHHHHAPVAAHASTGYAAQFLSSSASKAGTLGHHHPRASTRTAVEATPLPTFPCEKSAIDRIFQQQTANGRERAFFVNDVGVVERQYNRWVKNLPTVRPFYAVKCNPDTTLLRVLAGLGTGFDCASGEEMKACLDLGVPPSDVIFANPIKNVKDLRYAASVGVTKMTFDNEAELYKVKEFHPEAELVLRLLADDSGSKMKFGVKFGAPQVQVEGLLRTAKALNLKVIGTSFHIGSGCMEASAYEKAIALSRSVFDLAVSVGLPRFTFLDLGGGYPGNPNENERSDDTPAFEEMTAVIRPSLERHFPAGCGVEVIGEPGRYMATAWSTLFVLVQGKREEPKRVPSDAAEKRRFLYYINDGVYGSFNSIMYDHAHPEPVPAYRFMSDKMSLDRRVHAQQNPYLSTAVPQATALATSFFSGALDAPQQSVGARAFHTTFGRDRDCVGTFFGPTCDSMDVVATDFPCEELFVGDWLAFQHSGAYTSAAATTFNGMQKATATYCRSRQTSPTAQ